MQKNYQCHVTGAVQGVGYRYYAVREARSLGLRGWVRNRDDGSVEVEAEGEASVLERFLGILRAGPSHARVESVRSCEADVKGYSSFEVRW